MDKKTQGVLFQLAGIILLIFVPVSVIPLKNLFGIASIIAGIIALGQASDVRSSAQSGTLKRSNPEIVNLLSAVVIGLLLAVMVPGFIKEYNAKKYGAAASGYQAVPEIRNFRLNDQNNETRNMEINEMIELDFMSKEEVLALRKKYVEQHSELLSGEYSPSEAVFGQIVGGKTWWGILGLSYYGPGEKSIEGPSEETRFIINPFLLVGLGEINAHIIGGTSLRPVPIYAKPVSLEWEGHTEATVVYQVGECWDLQVQYRYPDAKDHKLSLIAYNARDLGFNYLFVDKNRSNNVRFNSSGAPVQIPQFIHCGGSSGYPGGSNNMSPFSPELDFHVSSLPAVVYIKLWRDMPATVDSPADMIFIVDIKA